MWGAHCSNCMCEAAQTVQALQQAGLYHGHLSPDSFRLPGNVEWNAFQKWEQPWFHDLKHSTIKPGTVVVSQNCHADRWFLKASWCHLSRFYSDQAHSPLKLVDFGLELKATTSSIRVTVRAWQNEIGHNRKQGLWVLVYQCLSNRFDIWIDNYSYVRDVRIHLN